MNIPLSVAKLALAAGRSSRMGAVGNKLLVDIYGAPLVRRTVSTVLASDSGPVLVVTGHMDTEIRSAIAGLEVEIVENVSYTSGMASSLIAGVSVLRRWPCDGVMIILADMPALTPVDLNQLLMRFRQADGQVIVRATGQGVPGNPVVFPRSFYLRMLQLKGDVGAKILLEQSDVPVLYVEIGQAAHIDVDTPDLLIAATNFLRHSISATSIESS